MTKNEVLKQMQQIALRQNRKFNNRVFNDSNTYQFKLIDCISKITVGHLVLHLS